MPTARACTSASHASSTIASPSSQRNGCGHEGQAAGPARSMRPPPSTHSAVIAHHRAAGACSGHTCVCSAPPTATSRPAAPMATPLAAPLSRIHSQAAAAKSASDSHTKGARLSAASAARMTSTSATAVMTRCLSMLCKAARAGGLRALGGHHRRPDGAEAAVALGVGRERGIDLARPEVGPQAIGEEELRVG
jgi:hypothetical protein